MRLGAAASAITTVVGDYQHAMSVAEPQPAVPKPKRRWYQYGLRSLFVVTTCAALLLGWIAGKYRSLPTDDYGYARNCFLRDAITFSSCGTAALICLALAVAFFCAVRYSRIQPVLASVLYVPLAVGTASIPSPLARTTAWLLSHESVFWGDNSFELSLAEGCMFWFSGIVILAFILAICCVRRPPTPPAR